MSKTLAKKSSELRGRIEALLSLSDDLCDEVVSMLMDTIGVLAEIPSEELPEKSLSYFILSGTVQTSAIAKVEAIDIDAAIVKIETGEGIVELEPGDVRYQTFQWDGTLLDPVDAVDMPLISLGDPSMQSLEGDVMDSDGRISLDDIDDL